MNVILDEPAIRTAVAEQPDWCSQRYSGKRLAAVAVDLARAPERKLPPAHRRERWGDQPPENALYRMRAA
ncbi:MAG: hypothetical protein ACLP01_32195 [Solirubrobacteraceae bacterium]